MMKFCACACWKRISDSSKWFFCTALSNLRITDLIKRIRGSMTCRGNMTIIMVMIMMRLVVIMVRLVVIMIIIIKEDADYGEDSIRWCSTMSCLSRLLYSINVRRILQLAVNNDTPYKNSAINKWRILYLCLRSLSFWEHIGEHTKCGDVEQHMTQCKSIFMLSHYKSIEEA